MNKTLIKILIIEFVCIIAVCVAAGYFIWQNNEVYNMLDATKYNLSETMQELNNTKDELDTTQENLQAEINKSFDLSESLEYVNAELNAANEKLEAANMIIEDLQSEEYELLYIGDYKLTHYCSELYEHICGTGSGLTATGTYVTPGRTVAVDPKVIPYGTEMYIEGYGWRTAEDCGGAVDGKHIDIAVNTHPEAMNMGVQNGGVWILVKKNS